VTYKPEPVVGMSIGPTRGLDAASLGGFIRVGSDLYAMSARHAFEDSMKTCELRVSHPAHPDLALVVPPDPRARQYSIGRVSMCSPSGTYRPSLTFQGVAVPESRKMVEMDWCVGFPFRPFPPFLPFSPFSPPLPFLFPANPGGHLPKNLPPSRNRPNASSRERAR
jgi:hypothetical protein